MLDNQGARGFYTRLLSPIVKLLAAAGVSPDAVTWTGTLLTCAVAFVGVTHGWLWQTALLLGLLVLTDGMDGQLARRTGKVSPYGAFLDSTLDRLADGAIVGAATLWLSWHGSRVWAVLGVVALVLGQVTSYTKARAESLDYTCAGGLAGRADRLVIILVAMLLQGLGLTWALGVAMVLLCLAGTVTVGQRMHQVHRQAAQRLEQQS